jgi:predicted Zn-dependent peptidase
MKNYLLILTSLVLIGFSAKAQQVEFEEFDLDNGLHVILHQDNTAPVIITSVMYNVGGKDAGGSAETPRTGFAHFFEHLLFEGTENIERVEFAKIVLANGGTLNANTSQDRTYYYDIFPSNKLELGLWLESERMLHPVIDQVGVDTQNEVVKEEKRQRYESPYGKFQEALGSNLFKVHPYNKPNIGYMEDLDASTLEEFNTYFKDYYGPNNAVLIVAGDIDKNETKELVKKYFNEVKRGPDVTRNFPKEQPITVTEKAKVYDKNIQIPAIIAAYRTPGFGTKDAYILDMISSYLS